MKNCPVSGPVQTTWYVSVSGISSWANLWSVTGVEGLDHAWRNPPERSSRWLSDMGNDVQISSLNPKWHAGWKLRGQKSLQGAEISQVRGRRPITPTFHLRCRCSPGPNHLVLLCKSGSGSPIFFFLGCADRRSSSLLGLRQLAGYNLKYLDFIVAEPRAML